MDPRYGDAELSSWSNRQRIQTKEEINKLKQSLGVSSKQDDRQSTQAKISEISSTRQLLTKLSNRKARAALQQNFSKLPQVASKTDELTLSTNFKDELLRPTQERKTPGSKEFADLRSERDNLLNEKQVWLQKISEDNILLSKLFKHIAEVKNRLMRKIDELEIEKDKFRSLRLETLEGTFEDIIVGDCELSPERRRAYPFERQELANSLYDRLVPLCARCKSNQMDVLEFVAAKVRAIENSFIEEKDSEVEGLMDELTNIASGKPGNILAAHKVASSLSEAVVNAIVERSMEALPKRGPSGGASKFGPSKESVPTRVGRPYANDNELKELQAQNEALRATVSQLRRSGYQSKFSKAADVPESTAAAAAAAAAAATGSKADRRGVESANGPSETKSRAGHSDAISAGSGSAWEAEAREAILTAAALLEAAPVRAVETVEDFERAIDQLPEYLKRVFVTLLENDIKQVVEAHPLAVGLRLSALGEATSSCAQEVRGLCARLLQEVGFFRQNGDSLRPQDVEQAMQQILQLAAVRIEIASNVTMALTYLTKRSAAPAGSFTRGSVSPRDIKPLSVITSIPQPAFSASRISSSVGSGLSARPADDSTSVYADGDGMAEAAAHDPISASTYKVSGDGDVSGVGREANGVGDTSWSNSSEAPATAARVADANSAGGAQPLSRGAIAIANVRARVARGVTSTSASQSQSSSLRAVGGSEGAVEYTGGDFDAYAFAGPVGSSGTSAAAAAARDIDDNISESSCSIRSSRSVQSPGTGRMEKLNGGGRGGVDDTPRVKRDETSVDAWPGLSADGSIVDEHDPAKGPPASATSKYSESMGVGDRVHNRSKAVEERGGVVGGDLSMGSAPVQSSREPDSSESAEEEEEEEEDEGDKEEENEFEDDQSEFDDDDDEEEEEEEEEGQRRQSKPVSQSLPRGHRVGSAGGSEYVSSHID